MGGYGMLNRIRIDTRIPWRCRYAYIDIPEHRADGILIRSSIPIRFERREMGKSGSDYVIVFCSFGRRYEEGFLGCMADLERALLREGYSDYSDFCRSVFGPLSS